MGAKSSLPAGYVPVVTAKTNTTNVTVMHPVQPQPSYAPPPPPQQSVYIAHPPPPPATYAIPQPTHSQVVLPAQAGTQLLFPPRELTQPALKGSLRPVVDMQYVSKLIYHEA